MTSVTSPENQVTTFGHVDDNTATVTDPLGGVMTITFDGARNVTGLQSPLDERITYTWDDGRMAAYETAEVRRRYGDSQLLRVLFGCGRGGKRKLNLGRARALG